MKNGWSADSRSGWANFWRLKDWHDIKHFVSIEENRDRKSGFAALQHRLKQTQFLSLNGVYSKSWRFPFALNILVQLSLFIFNIFAR